MEVFGLSAAQIDLVAIVSNDVGVDYTLLKKHDWTVQDYIFENENFWKPKFYENKLQDLIFDVMKHKICKEQFPLDYWQKKTKSSQFANFNRSDMSKIVSKFLGVDEILLNFLTIIKAMLFILTTCRVFPGARFYLLPLTVGEMEETLQLGSLIKTVLTRKLGLIQTAILLVFIGI